MKYIQSPPVKVLTKAPTGISGFDLRWMPNMFTPPHEVIP
jgi:hypothetical protein